MTLAPQARRLCLIIGRICLFWLGLWRLRCHMTMLDGLLIAGAGCFDERLHHADLTQHFVEVIAAHHVQMLDTIVVMPL